MHARTTNNPPTQPVASRANRRRAIYSTRVYAHHDAEGDRGALCAFPHHQSYDHSVGGRSIYLDLSGAHKPYYLTRTPTPGPVPALAPAPPCMCPYCPRSSARAAVHGVEGPGCSWACSSARQNTEPAGVYTYHTCAFLRLHNQVCMPTPIGRCGEIAMRFSFYFSCASFASSV